MTSWIVIGIWLMFAGAVIIATGLYERKHPDV